MDKALFILCLQKSHPFSCLDAYSHWTWHLRQVWYLSTLCVTSFVLGPLWYPSNTMIGLPLLDNMCNVPLADSFVPRDLMQESTPIKKILDFTWFNICLFIITDISSKVSYGIAKDRLICFKEDVSLSNSVGGIAHSEMPLEDSFCVLIITSLWQSRIGSMLTSWPSMEILDLESIVTAWWFVLNMYFRTFFQTISSRTLPQTPLTMFLKFGDDPRGDFSLTKQLAYWHHQHHAFCVPLISL